MRDLNILDSWGMDKGTRVAGNRDKHREGSDTRIHALRQYLEAQGKDRDKEFLPCPALVHKTLDFVP